MENRSRLPSLDGLRALSIALVLLGHLSGTPGSPIPAFFKPLSNFGVRVFFVISGYLITSILVKEQEKTGTISLRSFYLRRSLRIFPAAYFYITAVVLLAGRSLRGADIAAAYAYLTNYVAGAPWLFGHLWSLAVEEQFYLLWPFLLLIFFPNRRALAAVAIVLAPVMRIGFCLSGFPAEAAWRYFPCVADALATGCLLAMIQPQMDQWAPRLDRPWFGAVPLIALSAPLWPTLAGDFGAAAYMLFGVTLMHFGIALSIDRAIRKRYAALNHPAVVWIGILSYSIYLWQEPFLDRQSSAWYAVFPLNLILAFTLATLSYYAVERPFLRLRERFS